MTNRFCKTVLVILAFFVAPNLVAKEVWHMANGNTTHKYVLDNGLEVFITENKRAPLVSVYHWVKVGSLHERKGITGISHLFEHMMFRPVTKGGKNFFDLIQPLGASANANTRYMATVYTTTVPKENLAALLSIESQRFQNLMVSKDLLDIERKAVWSEYSTKFDTSPVIDIWGKVYESAFDSHPYEWTIIGYREDLNKINAKDANDYFRSFYNPSNTALFISGDLDAARVLSIVKKYYRDWQPGQKAMLPEPYKKKTKMIIAQGRVKSAGKQVLAGFRLIEEKKHALEYYVLNHILFGSSNSLATKRLQVKKRLVSSVSDFNYDYDSGMMKVFMIGLDSNWRKLIPQIIQLKSDFKNMSDAEFAAYKREFKYGFQEGILSNTSYNSSLALAWGKYENPNMFFNFTEKIEKVTKNDLEKVLEIFYKQDNFILVRAKN